MLHLLVDNIASKVLIIFQSTIKACREETTLTHFLVNKVIILTNCHPY